MRILLFLMTVFFYLSMYAMDTREMSLVKIVGGQTYIPIMYMPEIKAPRKISLCTQAEVDLLVSAFDAAKENRLQLFLESLKKEYEASCTNRKMMPGRLRTLLSVAGELQAIKLSALCFMELLLPEISKKISSHMAQSPEITGTLDRIDKYIFANAVERKEWNSRELVPVHRQKNDWGFCECYSKKATYGMRPYNGSVWVTELKTEGECGTLSDPMAHMRFVTFSQDEKFLAVGGPCIQVWDIQEKNNFKKVFQKDDAFEELYKPEITTVALNPNGSLVAATAKVWTDSDLFNGEIYKLFVKVFDIKTAAMVCNIETFNPPVENMRLILLNDRIILVDTCDYTIEWDFQKGHKALAQLNFVDYRLLYNLFKLSLKRKKEDLLLKQNSMSYAIYSNLPNDIKKWVETLVEVEGASKEICVVS